MEVPVWVGGPAGQSTSPILLARPWGVSASEWKEISRSLTQNGGDTAEAPVSWPVKSYAPSDQGSTYMGMSL